MELTIGKLYRVTAIHSGSDKPSRFARVEILSNGKSRENLHFLSGYLPLKSIVMFLGDLEDCAVKDSRALYPTFLLGEHVIGSVDTAERTYSCYEFEEIS